MQQRSAHERKGGARLVSSGIIDVMLRERQRIRYAGGAGGLVTAGARYATANMLSISIIIQLVPNSEYAFAPSKMIFHAPVYYLHLKI